MKRTLGTSFVLLVVALSTALGGQNPDVAGSWDITIESPQGKNTSLLIIKRDGDKLSALMKSPRGERPLDSVSVKGDEITMVVTRQIQGQDMKITYKGKVTKDSMKGDADFGGMATGSWSAVPHKEDATPVTITSPSAPPATGANISGVWDFAVQTSAGSGNPTFTFKQEGENLTGTYKGQFGEAPLTGTVKGVDIKFIVKVSAQGQDITITYAGKVEGKDNMKGTAALGELGEGTWTAKRKQ